MNWQTAETAPHEGMFLVWDGQDIEMAERGRNGAFLIAGDPAPHTIHGVTHWHPLPDAPRVENMQCASDTNPDHHIGPILCEPVGGLRHWYCQECGASMTPPEDGKARLKRS